jgi:hypothetical protein
MTRPNVISRIGLTALLALAAAFTARGQAPSAPQPVTWVDYDERNIPEPQAAPGGYYYDSLDGTFFQHRRSPPGAQNRGRPKESLKLIGAPSALRSRGLGVDGRRVGPIVLRKIHISETIHA